MTIQSVSRAFTILRTVARYPDGISVTELARKIDLHKSTVSRLLSTLEKEDAVERVRRRYRIGNGLAALSFQTVQSRDLMLLLEPYLYRLVNEFGESAGLCVLEGFHTRTVAQVQGHHNIQVRDWTGERFPLHLSSGGKHFLAHFPHFRREEYLADLPEPYTDKSLTDPSDLRQRLIEVRRQGYDWTFEEFEEGLVAVSVPVFDRFDRVAAVIYLCGPIFRFPDGQQQQDIITKRLVKTCQEASELVASQSSVILSRTVGAYE